jgi:Holliday junction resolvasome RuvABC endonuclease subunit
MTEMLRVVGMDLSLTSSGVSDGWVCHAFHTGPGKRIEHRLDYLARSVVQFADGPGKPPCDLAVIEGPAFSRSGPGHEELAALRLMVRTALWRRGVPVAIVPPTTLKLYTTGHGNSPKSEMVRWLDARHGTDFAGVLVKDGRYDQADAFALAMMGRAHVGQPLPVLAGFETLKSECLDKVEWPELVSDGLFRDLAS